MPSTSSQSTRSLRNLYFVRTAFQIAWAATLLAVAIPHPTSAAFLFLLYPLWDVACTLFDLRNLTHSATARTSQSINALLGIAAAIGIGLTVFHHAPLAIAVFGAWAAGAGLLQLLVALQRRRHWKGSGQWSMILSGAQSTLAGIAFIVLGLGEKRHIRDVAGYAIFGAFYFLIGAVLLNRKLSAQPVTTENEPLTSKG
jgi:hypothetical protein